MSKFTMLMRFLVSILLFTVSCQTTSACICTRKQHAGNSAIELIVSPVNPVDGENVCFCCYSKITRTVRTVYFHRNGARVCEVKDSGPVKWEDGNFTCKRVNGTLTVFEVNPTEFNISGITCQNKPNVRRREKASVQGLPHIKEQKWKDFRNRTVENTTTYNLTSFSNSTKFNNLTTFKISTSTVKDSNWVIPEHVSLASFVLTMVALIILVVLLILVKKIIRSLKLKRYKRTSIQRIDNELMNTTLQISSSMESHIYESIPDLAVTPGIKRPCSSPGTRARRDSSVVTNLGIPCQSNPVSTSTQRHDTENEKESSPFLQNNCQDNHHQSNMNITTSVTYKFPPESDLSGNDCPQMNACLRRSSKNCVRNPILNDDYLTPIHLSNNNVSVSSLYIASNPDHSQHKTSSPSTDGYIVPSSVRNKERPLYMGSKPEVTLDLSKHSSVNTTCSPTDHRKESLRFDMPGQERPIKVFQANQIWALNKTKPIQLARMSALETAI